MKIETKAEIKKREKLPPILYASVSSEGVIIEGHAVYEKARKRAGSGIVIRWQDRGRFGYDTPTALGRWYRLYEKEMWERSLKKNKDKLKKEKVEA